MIQVLIRILAATKARIFKKTTNQQAVNGGKIMLISACSRAPEQQGVIVVKVRIFLYQFTMRVLI